jgi:hypothetical protein
MMTERTARGDRDGIAARRVGGDALVTSTVVLTRRQITLLRQVAAVRTAHDSFTPDKNGHSVSSVLREVLEHALPQFEEELSQTRYPPYNPPKPDDK